METPVTYTFTSLLGTFEPRVVFQELLDSFYPRFERRRGFFCIFFCFCSHDLLLFLAGGVKSLLNPVLFISQILQSSEGESAKTQKFQNIPN
jgi:hypothetical protein